MSDDYLLKCLWKGVADTEQQQDAAFRIEELEGAIEWQRGRAEAAEAKLAKAVEWRLIETAPTYEAVLICGGDVLYPCVASLNNGEWDAEAQGGILREDIAECPTHWMPLPAPLSQN